MTTSHVIEAVVGLGLASLLAWRLYRLPALLRARDNVNSVTAQALLGQTLTQAQQYAVLPWVPDLTAATGTSAPSGQTSPAPLGAGDWYDPTVSSYPVTLNEFGFITSPSPAPVNPKTGAVPLTNADVCAWVGHMPGNPCPRCGAPNA